MTDFSTNEWAAIEQQVRECFIKEDAPEHLSVLEQNLLQLDRIGGSTPDINSTQWQELTRSIHTLKGSAGLSQLHNLSTLAHRLEDVLLALGNRCFPDPVFAMEVLLLGVDEMRQQLTYIAEHDRDSEPSPLIESIDLLLSQSGASSVTQLLNVTSEFNLVFTVLETDFKSCLQRTQNTLESNHFNYSEKIDQYLHLFIQDCRTLGEILQVDWLLSAVPELEAIVLANPDQRVSLIQNQLEKLEALRLQTLQSNSNSSSDLDSPSSGLLLNESDGTENPIGATPERIKEKFAPAIVPVHSNLSSNPATGEITMRVPVRQLDNLANTVGDLLIQSERLGLDQRRLRQATQGLKKQTRQFYQLRERIQNCYDELLLPGLRSKRLSPLRSARLVSESNVSLEINNTNNGSEGRHSPLGLKLANGEEFDPLELDRFTDLHTLLQDLQEFLSRIDEYGDDLDLSVQSAQDSHDHLSQELGTLRQSLTAARMVDFSSLAERFRRPLWDLNQRYHKDVKLLVQGGETEIDRAVLDALYDPLLHLIRNAFDHGQESPQYRQEQGKSPQGKLTLKAEQSGTMVVISVTDDGQGIDLQKVGLLAKSKGLLRSDQPTGSEILSCLFAPGFSTADRAGELSGRGVGLDVVKSQIEKLRGSIQVQTRQGKGTRFTLRVPSTLNILPLLLCQQERSSGSPVQMALPSSQVLELVELSPADLINQYLSWRGHTLPLLALTRLVPASTYPWQVQSRPTHLNTPFSRNRRSDRMPGFAFAGTLTRGGIAIVLHSTTQPIALQVDLLLEEREMVLKPVESWLALPSYIGGCTVLPQGQVVPVLSPEALSQTNGHIPQPVTPKSTPVSPSKSFTILIVDDSVAARRWLVHALHPLGHEVIECRDGQEAWEQLQTGTPFHLMICDVEMPRMDGFQLLQQVRQDPRWSHLSVVMLTSRQSDRHRQQAKQLGATGYFVKPLGIQELIRAIDTFLPQI